MCYDCFDDKNDYKDIPNTKSNDYGFQPSFYNKFPKNDFGKSLPYIQYDLKNQRTYIVQECLDF